MDKPDSAAPLNDAEHFGDRLRREGTLQLLTLLRADLPPDETSTLAKLFAAEQALFDEVGANILNRAALKNALRERDEARAERDGLSAEVFGANAEMDKAIDRMRKAKAESSRLQAEMARQNPKMGGK